MSTLLQRLAALFAIAGVAVACIVAAMVVASVGGRAAAGAPVPGDVELTQFGIALAISLGLPWCQWRRANIIVDFFTQKLSPRAQLRLDAIGTLLVAAMCALLAWRTAVGAFGMIEARETTMIIGLPMWWTYASLAPGLALAALIALWQGHHLWRGREVPLPEGAAE